MKEMTLIKNARWLSDDGEFEEGQILIYGDKIKALGQNLAKKKIDTVFDARGMSILPGAIDPHVHFRQPGQAYKEGVANVSKAALKGGVTTVLDMPNNKPPCTTLQRLLDKKEIFRKKSLVNWGLHLHAQLSPAVNVKRQIKSAKVYMAQSSALPALTETEDLKRLFKYYSLLAIHAEDETKFDSAPQRSPLHHENRPRAAVVSALQKIEQALKALPEQNRPRLVICHMNSAEDVDWLRRMKVEGFDVWGETAPHYLYFTQENYIREGNRFKVNPPIRSNVDRAVLRLALMDGVIDFIGTDHAPHTQDEKNSAQPPSGIAGIEWLLPVMLSLKEKDNLSWRRMQELLTQNAARCYGIKKRDGIKAGNFADLVFLAKSEIAYQDQTIQTKAAVNVFKDIPLNWRVAVTMVNGSFKYRGGKYISSTNGYEV